MLSKALTLVSCAALAFTVNAEVDKRAAADPAAFTSAANELIAKYIPSDVLALLTPAISQAAAAASVTGDPASLFTSALEGSTLPAWFPTQVPPQFASQFGALTQAIADLRPAAAVVLTSTNSAGSVITTTLPGTVIGGGVVVTSTDSAGSVITTSLPASSGVVITSTNSAGSIITTTLPASAPSGGGVVITTTNSAGSVITTTKAPSQTTDVVPVTTTNSAGSTITTSGTTTRPAGTSSTNAGTMPTANAAGLLALLGVLAAL